MKSALIVQICPHCGNRTPHEERFNHHCRVVWYDDDGEPHASTPDDPPIHYRILECQTCGDIVLYQGVDNELVTEKLVYPSDVTLDDSVPSVVASNYNEAKRVQTASPNAFAVLIGVLSKPCATTAELNLVFCKKGSRNCQQREKSPRNFPK